MSNEAQEFHIEVSANQADKKIPAVLADATGLSQQTIKSAMEKGALWLEAGKTTRRIRRAGKTLSENTCLHFYYAPKILALEPTPPILIADEQDYSVWFKPSGLLCQGSKWSDHCTINRWVESQRPFAHNPQRNCFIVHRLDKAAQGLVLLAHTKQTAQQLSRLFATRAIEKDYLAKVAGEFPTEKIITEEPVDGKSACSIIERVSFDSGNNQSLLKVTIKTGRKHQIRQHLSYLSYPIIGDRLYGDATNTSTIDLQLQSYRLRFECPLTAEIRYYETPSMLALFS